MVLWKTLGHSLAMRMIQNESEKAPFGSNIDKQVDIDHK